MKAAALPSIKSIIPFPLMKEKEIQFDERKN